MSRMRSSSGEFAARAGRGIEFQLPAGEHHVWVAVRGSLAVNPPPPSGPPVDPKGGAADEEETVVMIPDRRDKGEAGQFAPEPNVLVVGGRNLRQGSLT